MISVIVPVYNAQKRLSACLDSLLNQTLSNDLYEIILLNDGSKDQSADICREYAKKYSNIVFIDKENEGVSKTRNFGIRMAKGDYIVFVDNDDQIEPDYLATHYHAIKDSDFDLVISGYKRMKYNGEVIHQELLKDTEWSKYIIMAPWARIYRKSFLIDNHITFFDYGIGEDVVFNLKVLSKTDKIKIIFYSGYQWMYNEESVSNTSQRGLKETVDIRVLLEEILKCNKHPNQYLTYFIERYYIWYLLFSGRSSDKATFINYYCQVKEFLKANALVSDISPMSPKISGESLFNRMIVLLFQLTERLHLMKVFAYLYCKG